ncbi:DUF992 domain-containing protein [Aliihoeflea sp. PC F10.4]
MFRTIAATALLGASAIIPAHAQDTRTEAGLLECVIEGDVGAILGSSRDMECVFNPSDGAPQTAFVGVVNRYGLDIGVTSESIMQWAVLMPATITLTPGEALSGDYVGASAEATAVIGGGANVLVGGSQQSVMLQPLSVQAQTGLNLALGVTEFRLRAIE